LIIWAYAVIFKYLLKSERSVREMGVANKQVSIKGKVAKSILLLVGCTLLLWLPVFIISFMTLAEVAIPHALSR